MPSHCCYSLKVLLLQAEYLSNSGLDFSEIFFADSRRIDMIFRENLKGIALVISEINSVKIFQILLLQAQKTAATRLNSSKIVDYISVG